MTDVSRRKRQPKGAPASAGGEFAGNSHDEATSLLGNRRDDHVVFVTDPYGRLHTMDHWAKIHHISEDDTDAVRYSIKMEGVTVMSERVIDFSEVGSEGIDCPEALDVIQDGNQMWFRSVTVREGENSGAEVTVLTVEPFEIVGMTPSMMDHYAPIIHEEMNKRGIHISGDWELADIELTGTLPEGMVTDSFVTNKAYDLSATWMNMSDPGTFGHGYMGNPILERIKDTRLVDHITAEAGRRRSVAPTEFDGERISDEDAIAIASELGNRSLRLKAFAETGTMRELDKVYDELDDVEAGAPASPHSGEIMRAQVDALRQWISMPKEFS